jgi:uncharacterized flavoprotein (TIGR03862 family)
MPFDVKVIGAGPAGLMAAEVLARGGAKVVIHDRMKAPARKFLLAGRGGLNLTHSEPLDRLLARYGEARNSLEPAIRAFGPQEVVAWCHGLGIETFVGTSGRIFPKQLKASPLLRTWLRRLQSLGVELKTESPWEGPDEKPTILAMGGASWPQLGSNAAWVPVLEAHGIEIKPFQPANSRFIVPWSEHFASRFAGAPIKNVRLTYRGETARGEVMISRDGIEGGAVYALSKIMRDQPGGQLVVDLKPDLKLNEVTERLLRPRGKNSLSNHLRKVLGLTPPAIGLLREMNSPVGAELVKSLPLTLIGPAGLARAISSAGGVSLGEVDRNFRLLKLKNHYAVGEMLDWEAPTGGYLLQACFSTAVAAARDCLLNGSNM